MPAVPSLTPAGPVSPDETLTALVARASGDWSEWLALADRLPEGATPDPAHLALRHRFQAEAGHRLGLADVLGALRATRDLLAAVKAVLDEPLELPEWPAPVAGQVDLLAVAEAAARLAARLAVFTPAVCRVADAVDRAREAGVLVATDTGLLAPVPAAAPLLVHLAVAAGLLTSVRDRPGLARLVGTLSACRARERLPETLRAIVAPWRAEGVALRVEACHQVRLLATDRGREARAALLARPLRFRDVDLPPASPTTVVLGVPLALASLTVVALLAPSLPVPVSVGLAGGLLTASLGLAQLPESRAHDEAVRRARAAAGRVVRDIDAILALLAPPPTTAPTERRVGLPRAVRPRAAPAGVAGAASA